MERSHLEELGVVVRKIILNFFKEMGWRHGLD